MAKKRKKPKMEFRYYQMPAGSPILALLGQKWRQNYGKGVDYLHFHNYLEIGFCYEGEGHLILGQKKTWLPLSKLESIRYRAISDEYAFNKFDSYISFCFDDNLKIFTGLACDTWPGDLFRMEYQKHSYLNKEIVASIIFSKKLNWSSLENGEIKTFYESEMERSLIR